MIMLENLQEVSQIMSQKNWQSHKSQLKELIKKCSEKHGQLTKDAAMGTLNEIYYFHMY